MAAKTKSWIANRWLWLVPLSIWTAAVATSLVFTLRHGEQAAFDIARHQGRDIFQTIVAMRSWNAESGGVYVRQSERNQPNPYLDIPDRDPVTTSGIHLTAINPAYMTRQMGGVIERDTGIRIRITSNKPINPGNAPAPWEANALRAFEQGDSRELTDLDRDPELPTIRYIAPLFVTEPCMSCHRRQGYKIGDVRGAISVSIPAAPFLASLDSENRSDVAMHGLSWLAGMLLFLYGLGQARRRWLQIATFSDTLEARVRDRTQELQAESLRRRDAEAEARQLAERNQSILQASPDGFWLLDQDGIIIDVNDAYCAMIGLPRESILSRDSAEFEMDCDTARVADRLQQLGEQGTLRFETRHEVNGRTIEVEASIAAIPALSAFSCFLRDITERKRVEERVRLSATVFTHAREGIMITDTDGVIVEVNESFTQITGYSRREAIGQRPSLLSSGKHDSGFYKDFWDTIKRKGYWYGEIWNRRKNGEYFVEYLTVSAAYGDDGAQTHYIALFSDITSHKEHERQIEHIRHFDTLTALPNRTLFGERMRQTISFARRSGRIVTIAYLDLDGFRELNDSIGRDWGDRILVELAGRLTDLIGLGDTVARIGGDEFALVLVDFETREQAQALLKQVLERINEPFQIGARSLGISASIGATFFPQAEAVDAEQLFRQADQAMYQAKLAGKNRLHVFDTTLDQKVRGIHASIEEIERGLAASQFVLHMQPKVNMKSGAIIGAEALIRWNHPTRGFLPPGAFLPITEDSAVSIAIGEWVIEQALKHLEIWQARGFTIPVSVNISGRHLQTGDFVDKLQAILARHPDVDPSHLEIEVLETSALSDITHVTTLINECRMIGVNFALDDFGTGYSSLSYLKRLPVSTLKIDQGFVRDMLEDPDDLAILDGVISLAKAFRHELVAEGVETVEHGRLLLHLGCQLGQGYGIAKPMPAEDFVHWAAEWKPPVAWQTAPMFGREDYALLAAEVEHRAWVKQVECFLRGEAPGLPPLETSRCQFGQWLTQSGRRRHASHPLLPRIEARHDLIHRKVETILNQRKQRDGNWLDEALLDLRDESRQLLDDLEQLVDRGA